ncbi:MAG: tetratricopeptide repeat protein, partial [Planctomycetota bacterium]
ALIRFLGAEAAFTKPVPRPRNAAPPAQPPAPAGIAAAPQPAGPPAVVPGGARARAWKFIDHGDRHFKAGRYRDALSRYKKATASAPDLAAARFREGFAYLGLGAVDRAALSIRRGLARDPAWPQSDFVLDDLFVDNDSRQAVQRAVAAELRDSPNNSEARLLAGVLLHFDGQPRAAEKQFRRVIAIAGQDAAAALFLPPPVDPPPANEEAR